MSGGLFLFAVARLTAQETAGTSNAADVRFMQGMIAHHAQAIEMAALVIKNTRRADLRLLAEKIDVSQKDEIAMMQRWLRERGQVAPEPELHDHVAGGQHQMPMPGMLAPEQMTALTAARDAAFDRFFLTGMIQHHEGALTMVAQLFGSIGAAQASDIFRFASDVDADQRGEIARMRTMLPSIP
jgi:uncharacterized protein (DUF305 family)